jgi:hypothetical protein
MEGHGKGAGNHTSKSGGRHVPLRQQGFGHQVATDYLQVFLSNGEHRIKIVDRELASAPFNSLKARTTSPP